MSFNPDPNKQAIEVRFSHKINSPTHPPLYFNNQYDLGSSCWLALIRVGFWWSPTQCTLCILYFTYVHELLYVYITLH